MPFMYILKCSDNSYYVGSAKNLYQRVNQHYLGLGSKYTKSRLPIELIYYEEYDRIDDAFNREKQIQGWNRKKKESLINGTFEELPIQSIAYSDKKQ